MIFTGLCGMFRKPFSRQKGAIVSLLVGFIPLGALFLSWAANFNIGTMPHQVLRSGIYLFSIYISFSYIYLHVFNLSETGRRIRILLEIYKKGPLERVELVKSYTCRDMMSNRLKRLVALEGLRLVKDRYVAGNKIFLLTARVIFGFRRVLFPDNIPDSKKICPMGRNFHNKQQ